MIARRGLPVLLVALGVLAALVARHDCTPGQVGEGFEQGVTVIDRLAATHWLYRTAVLLVVLCAAGLAIPRVRRLMLSRYAVFAVPLAGIALFLWFKRDAGISNGFYLCHVREDGVVENATAVFFFAAAAVSSITSTRLFRRRLRLAALFPLAFAALTLFMGLEEISYGQRLIGYSTPARIAAANEQQEFNLHNLEALEWLSDDLAPQVIMKWGLYGWIVLLLASRTSRLPDRWRRSVALIFPPWFVAAYFIPYQLWDYSFDFPWLWSTVIWQDQELCEMALALGFLAFSCHCMRTTVLSTSNASFASAPAPNR